jgi:Plasmid recombination enzyme
VSTASFLRLAKLSGAGKLLVAARHNLREIQAERGGAGSIDPARTQLNYVLVGPEVAGEVEQQARLRMAVAGVGELRKDAVRAVELLFSLPVASSVDARAYFTDCLGWVCGRFGGAANVLSAVVHLDEAAPHCHVLLLPLLGNRMQGSAMVGNKRALAGHQQAFHEAVAHSHGFATRPARMSRQATQSASRAVIQRLQNSNDPALKSALWPAIKDAIEAAPQAFAQTLGVRLPEPKKRPMRSFTAIMTSPGKGPKVERIAPKPIGFALEPYRAEPRTLSCVGFAQSAAAVERAAVPDSPNGADGVSRVRETDCDPGLWCERTGEFLRRD